LLKHDFLESINPESRIAVEKKPQEFFDALQKQADKEGFELGPIPISPAVYLELQKARGNDNKGKRYLNNRTMQWKRKLHYPFKKPESKKHHSYLITV